MIAHIPSPFGGRIALAMYIGKSHFHCDVFGKEMLVYVAIVLHHALRDIEMDYPHHVSDLKPFDIRGGPSVRPPIPSSVHASAVTNLVEGLPPGSNGRDGH